MDQMFKQMLEITNGRIRVSQTRRVYTDDIPKGLKPLTRHNGSLLLSMDKDGRETAFINQRSVKCTNPEKGQPFPQPGDHWEIPHKTCLQCEFHRKPKRGIPYPHCLFEKMKLGGAVGAMEQFGNMAGMAFTKAHEMLR